MPDAAEREYLNTLPTSFVLDDQAVDRLRLAAREAILASPEMKRLIASGALRMTGQGARRREGRRRDVRGALADHSGTPWERAGAARADRQYCDAQRAAGRGACVLRGERRAVARADSPLLARP